MAEPHEQLTELGQAIGLPSDDLLNTPGQREQTHQILAEGHFPPWAEAITAAARSSNVDTLEVVRQGEAATRWWVKPLWAMLLLGIPGLLLVVGQLWFADIDRALGLGLAKAVPWLRLLALIGGGVMVVMAAPAPLTPEKIELKTKRW
jgi:hypothetical protein